MENGEANQFAFDFGGSKYSQREISGLFEKIEILRDFYKFKKISGPFDGKINSTYVITNESQRKFIFRTRISKAFRYEPIVKEKILYPLLTGVIKPTDQDLGVKIKSVAEKREGSCVFSDESLPIIPVQQLYYYYEPHIFSTKSESVKLVSNPMFPYMFTVKSFTDGESLYDLIAKIPKDQLELKPLCKLMEDAGMQLAKLHTIRFDAFYDKIYQIGDEKKPSWEESFAVQLEKELKEAEKNKEILPMLPDIKHYFESNMKIIENEKNPVIFHNDFQSQNIIVKETDESKQNSKQHGSDGDLTIDGKDYEISGLIDFDNWRIGPPAQDFIKMEYWTIGERTKWKEAFYTGL